MLQFSLNSKCKFLGLIILSLYLIAFTQGLHMPAVHIPAFTGAHGLPVGLSVIAGRYRDQYPLKISKVFSEPLVAEGGWNFAEASASGKI